MAVLVKKTYSRRKEEGCSLNITEKENFDAFDELLSSPLKQDVEFKPLSFWGRKVKELEKNEDYESSDSDHNSTYRKKKPKWNNTKPKSRTLPLRNSNKVNKNIITTNSRTMKSKFSTAQNDKNSSFYSSRQNKGKFLDVALNINESTEKKNLNHNGCDGHARVITKLNHESFNSPLVECFLKTRKSSPNKPQRNSKSSLKFKVYKDVNIAKDLNADWGETMDCNENKELKNLTLNSKESKNEMHIPLHKYQQTYNTMKFVNTKRYYNSFKKNESFDPGWCCTFSKNIESSPESSVTSKKDNSNYESLVFTDHEDEITGKNLGNIDDTLFCDQVNYSFNESTTNLNQIKYIEKTDDEILTSKNSVNQLTAQNEESETMYLLELEAGSSFLDNSQFVNANLTEIKNLIEELLLQQSEKSVSGERESCLTSDENTSCVTDEESVIRVPVKSSKPSDTNTIANDTDYDFSADFEEKKYNPSFDSPSTTVSNLTTEISNLTISKAAKSTYLSEVDLKLQTEKVQNFSNDENEKEVEKNPVLIDLRNVTKRRKYRSIRRDDERSKNCALMNSSEKDHLESDEEIPEQWTPEEKTVFDWNKTIVFANPMFESTRVHDTSCSDMGKGGKMIGSSEESRGWLDYSLSLKPGKKWLRSVSILKQIRNGNVTAGCLESSRVKGRKYQSFVKDMLEMQNGKCGWYASMADLTHSRKHLTGSGVKIPFSESTSISCSDLESKSSLKDVTFKSSFFSEGSEKSMLEATLINPTIKVINSEEKTNEFGLDILFQDVKDSVKDESSNVSGKDFILLQCGQEDILPFEEYFNERTLKDCRKIGEGVYGEVFMSSDAVIKIIPIEGSEKVNGEPQKTFEEILSEVVIASKLSKLRNGERNRTDGFAEVKHCWCVRGKYPEYLLRLWDEFDQMGNGSENDSPIMFKDDQLYIVLELANGGKDLESFVFSSAIQSLSVFVQTTFSLAAAEKALEFEHRDLHWGNVLISQTKDKFVSVTLEKVEYKIPTKGVKVCIIDFTLSRICYEGLCIFNDLSVDPSLFASEGDYQFEIYRMMLAEVRNDWSLFRPKTNIFWLHYILDKMINMVRYKNKKTKLHKKWEKELEILESAILEYKDSAEFTASDPLTDLLKKL